jgi:hypothetical protein
MIRAYALRSVPGRKGYNYWAACVYELRRAQAGGYVWSKVGQGPARRTKNPKYHPTFDGAYHVLTARHNTKLTDEQAEQISGVYAPVAYDWIEERA